MTSCTTRFTDACLPNTSSCTLGCSWKPKYPLTLFAPGWVGVWADLPHGDTCTQKRFQDHLLFKDQIDHYHKINYPLSQGIDELVRNPYWGGTLANSDKVASEHQNYGEKNVVPNRIISGTEWSWYLKWGSNWRFLRGLWCQPIFEQVTLFRSSRKEGGRSAPPPGQLNKILKFDSLVVLTLII